MAVVDAVPVGKDGAGTPRPVFDRSSTACVTRLAHILCGPSSCPAAFACRCSLLVFQLHRAATAASGRPTGSGSRGHSSARARLPGKHEMLRSTAIRGIFEVAALGACPVLSARPSGAAPMYMLYYAH